VDAAVRHDDERGAQIGARPTIFARATGALPSAIAIVRVSGPAAGEALAALSGAARPDPRRAVVRHLFDGEGALLDEALVLWLPAPGTVTGEDMVELHLHGSRAVVAGVEAALGALDGLRAAEAGEFTRRAFENGRMDLSQVEGLADLLAAETARQRIAALTMSEGGLRRQVEAWQDRLLDLAARIEAAIDHDDEPDVVAGDIGGDADALGAEIAATLERPPAERLRDGIRVGIAGPPNAGKSSLINVLSGREAAIVSAVAGTTRDLIEVPLSLDGIPLVLIDMAGLRDPGDDIEAEGITRAQAAMDRCDILLWLGPPESAPFGAIKLAAKLDVDRPQQGSDIAVSALTGEGIGELRKMLASRAEALLPAVGELALGEGQRGHVRAAAAALSEVERQGDPVLQAECVRSARKAFDAITGRADTEAMLDALFSRFCIGK